MSAEPTPSTLKTWLRLGRISNLPTVWTNAATACVLSVSAEQGQSIVPWAVSLMLLTSVFYVAGMILNDAFDANYDAKFRPNRPIPRGDVSRRLAFGVGFGLLASSVVGVTIMAASRGHVAAALGSSLALGLAIVAYDAYHKNNPFSPLLMGLCRGLVYVMVGLTIGELGHAVLVAAALQIAYVVGLTYAAKQEDLAKPGSWWPLGLLSGLVFYTAALVCTGKLAVERWPLVACALASYLAWLGYATRPLLRRERNIGEGVGRLIAGIALLDAVLLAMTGGVVATVLAMFAVGLTRALHRVVPGT